VNIFNLLNFHLVFIIQSIFPISNSCFPIDNENLYEQVNTGAVDWGDGYIRIFIGFLSMASQSQEFYKNLQNVSNKFKNRQIFNVISIGKKIPWCSKFFPPNFQFWIF
jgi:hypothetical protein